jgi:hypothetical protein
MIKSSPTRKFHSLTATGIKSSDKQGFLERLLLATLTSLKTNTHGSMSLHKTLALNLQRKAKHHKTVN